MRCQISASIGLRIRIHSLLYAPKQAATLSVWIASREFSVAAENPVRDHVTCMASLFIVCRFAQGFDNGREMPQSVHNMIEMGHIPDLYKHLHF